MADASGFEYVERADGSVVGREAIGAQSVAKRLIPACRRVVAHRIHRPRATAHPLRSLDDRP